MNVNNIYLGDCQELLKSLPDNFVDSIVTDPPAGISFMGKEWDTFGKGNRGTNCRKTGSGKECASEGFAKDVHWNTDKKARDQFILWLSEVMKEGLRVLKPGGHALVWALPRTSHWTATALENAGFEIRDCVYHVFGSGFPKSLDISKAIDKQSRASDRLLEFAKLLKEKREKQNLSIAEADKLITGGSTMYLFLEGRIVDGVFTVYPPNKRYYERISDVFGLVGWESIVENNLDVIGVEEGDFGYQKDEKRWENKREITKVTTSEAKRWVGWGSSLKPATEIWLLCRKPLIPVPFLEVTNNAIKELLCQISPVKYAELFSTSNHHDLNEALMSDFARWVADASVSASPEELFAKMDMFKSQVQAKIFLNIVLLWSTIWVEIYEKESTFITSTMTVLITELKTLKLLTSLTMRINMQDPLILTGGMTQPVRLVEELSNAVVAKLQNILIVIAPKHAIVQEICQQKLEEEILAEQGIKEVNLSEFPAVECWWLCRKPLSEKTIAENVLKWGVGGLNIDACRIPTRDEWNPSVHQSNESIGTFKTGKRTVEQNVLGRFPSHLIHDGSEEVLAEFAKAGDCGAFAPVKSGQKGFGGVIYGKFAHSGDDGVTFYRDGLDTPARFFKNVGGCNGWNANIVNTSLDQQDRVEDFVLSLVAIEDNQEDNRLKNIIQPFMKEMRVALKTNSGESIERMKNTGIRLLQEAKHMTTEKLNDSPVNYVDLLKLINTTMIIQNLLSIDGFVEVVTSNITLSNMVLGERVSRLKYCAKPNSERDEGVGGVTETDNVHPTVKSTELMKYLIKLITPPKGIVLDMFAGSGSTLVAAKYSGFKFIGFELSKEYFEIARKRLSQSVLEV